MQYIYTGNSNITVNRHDFSLVGFDLNIQFINKKGGNY